MRRNSFSVFSLFMLIVTMLSIIFCPTPSYALPRQTIGGIYNATGSSYPCLIDSHGNLVVVGPLAVGSATSGYWPILFGAPDASGNAAFASIGTYGLNTETNSASAAVVLLAPTVDTTGAGHTVTSTAVTGLGRYKQIQILCDVTSVATAASDTVDIYIDTSPDAGTTWLNVVHFPQVLGNGGAKQFWATLDPGGAPPATTTTVTSDAAAGVVRPSMFTDRLRVRYVSVDGGSADTAVSLGVRAFAKN